MSDVEKFDQTSLDYFAMLFVWLLNWLTWRNFEMIELKELCFVVQMESSFMWRTMETDPDARP